MLKSFFTRFKDKLSIDYGGRYITAMIEQVAFDDPYILKALFPAIEIKKFIKSGIESALDAEYRFPSHTRRRHYRLADLVILDRGSPSALLEVKYEDEKDPQNRYQLKDYIRFIKNKRDASFTYLTKYIPPPEDLELIKKQRRENITHMLYSKLYEKLRKGQRTSATTRLFCKFLEENMPIYNSKISEKGLKLLLVKGLTLKHQTGLRRLASEENISQIPEIFSTLIGNLRTLGDRFFSEFKKYFNTRPIIDFGFEPEFDYKKVLKDIEINLKKGTERDFLPRKRKLGGNFYISFRCKLAQNNPNRWLNIVSGFSFWLELANKKLSKSLYAEIEGEGLEGAEKERTIVNLPKDANSCYIMLLPLIKDVIEMSIDNNPHMGGHFKRPLSKLGTDIGRRMKNI